MLPYTISPPREHCLRTLRIPDFNQTVTDWCSKNIILDSRESQRPGPFSCLLTPYTRKILDSCADPFIQKITFLGSTQIGKTRTPLNVVSYWIDNMAGDVLWVLPDEKMAGSFARRRFRPMLESMPILQQYRTGKLRDEHKTSFYLRNMTIAFAWSNSAAALSSFPISYIVFDEVDKYPSHLKNEADPISLGEERTAWAWYRKILVISSPTVPGSNIDRSWGDSAQHLFYVACPHCGHSQPLEFGNQSDLGGLKWPKGERNPARISGLQLAWYECRSCGGRIEERQKLEIMRHGEYRCVSEDPGPRPSHVGFKINALYSPVRSFSEVAAKFLAVKDDPIKLQNFKNSWLAENWEQKVVTVRRENLHRLAEGGVKRGGQLPIETQMLTAGVDVHGELKGFYWSVWAWAYGRRRWLIDYGQCFTKPDLLAAINERVWSTPDGIIFNPFIGIDSGWGETTAEIYEFVRQHYPQWQATKGMEELAGQKIRETPIDYSERNRPGGKRLQVVRAGATMALLLIDTNYMKDELANLLVFDEAQNEEKPERMFYLCEGVEDDFLASLASEYKRRLKGKESWVKVYHGAPNHLLDTAIIARAIAERRGLFRLPSLLQAAPSAIPNHKLKRPESMAPSLAPRASIRSRQEYRRY